MKKENKNISDDNACNADHTPLPAADTNLKKHFWLLVLIISVVVIASIVSYLTS